MAYGMSVKNGAGEVVIDNQYPVMVVTRTLTLNYKSVLNSIYSFDRPSLSGSEVMLMRPAVGQWVAIAGDWRNTGHMTSNKSSIYVAVLDDVSVQPRPGGYGAAVLSGANKVMWSHEIAMGYVRSALNVPKATINLKNSLSWDSGAIAGNAFAYTGGGMRVDLQNEGSWGVAGERTGTDTVKFYVRHTYGSSKNSGFYGYFETDLSAMLGNVS